MNFEEYQTAAHRTASYKTDSTMDVMYFWEDKTTTFSKIKKIPVYPFLKSTAEAAETLDKVVKVVFRGDEPGHLLQSDLEKEIGDDLWYIAERCTQLGVSMESIAIKNIEKLKDRMERGKIHGSGDNR